MPVLHTPGVYVYQLLFSLQQEGIRTWQSWPPHANHVTCIYKLLKYLKSSMEKGDNRFRWPQRSKVNKAFSASNKFSRLKFNSWNCVLLKFGLVVLLGNRNSLMTFDLLRLSKWLSPFSTGPFNYSFISYTTVTPQRLHKWFSSLCDVTHSNAYV